MNEVEWLNQNGIVCSDVPRIVGEFSFEAPIRIYKGCLSFRSHFGAYSYLSPNTEASHATIGRYTSVGEQVVLGPSQHNISTFTTSPFLNQNVFNLPGMQSDPSSTDQARITIGNDVWIGTRACVMDGITVGDGAVIGYGSVVTKDVPPYAVVAGSPARIIRYRFDEQTISELLDFAWWRLDIAEAHRSQRLPDFAEPREALAFFKAGEASGDIKPILPRRKRFERQNGRIVCVPFE